MSRKLARYGWSPDLPDMRDLKFSTLMEPVMYQTVLPPADNLESKCPPVFDQAQLGSCTLNSSGAMYEFVQRLERQTDFMPSRLFGYYNVRLREGTVTQDAGAQLRDVLKDIADQGLCREDLWPYDISKFADAPPPAAYENAKLHKAICYLSLDQDLTQFKTCIVAGYPFVFGFTVYDSFESAAVAKSGIVPMPTAGESVQGGHAVMAVGYDDTKQMMRVRNSWGASWGQGGYFEMPYAYITNPDLASDFWTIRTVERSG